MNTPQQHLTTRGQIIALREEGLTVRAIADRLAVSTHCEEVMSVCHSVNGIPVYDKGDPKTLLCLFSERRPRPRLTTGDEDAAIIAAIRNNPFSNPVAIREALHLDSAQTVRYDRAHIYEVARSGHVTLNVWGYISLHGMGDVFQIPGRFAANKYRDILRNQFLPLIQERNFPFPAEPITFIH
ncbi:hypothetical protein Hamer_G006747 [Homarus americanus]|uniref:Uncharacterized protein n=1 Tax=Homarus americanus TaxID=6706 RepID=A0A8J5JEH9_HOMAM|nr:hypothetical protein Hamer_G006747 [Homarus americanus]